ncbi:hypothetical protein [Thiohalomonas denitrificans]|uniref:Sulfotransferase family protein n=1 Tax=Thiohalomonas denitrificans TaxID=415747 RepID=A0A1G5Q6K7_9GAMM|nr:hypothetical protein [Thiohalomonas denitrificans]SCZ57494.1 hypothetical protein SAMN03097708_01439 [Thiohalomonas denitrificans]
MRKFLKYWLGLYKYARSRVGSSKLPTGSTVLIHIGKCGGRTVRDGIENAVHNFVTHEVHIKKPVYRKDLKYIIVARGPISRLVSAFQWRYKLVVSDGDQRSRFKGEYNVLIKYETLNDLAEALYHENGEANSIAHQEIRKIHHIREDISFYLRDLLSRCHPNQIVAVLMQENLNEDIFRVFGYRNKINRHRSPASKEDKTLSETGLKNLMRFFEEDYEALIKLYSWGKIDREVIVKAL